VGRRRCRAVDLGDLGERFSRNLGRITSRVKGWVPCRDGVLRRPEYPAGIFRDALLAQHQAHVCFTALAQPWGYAPGWFRGSRLSRPCQLGLVLVAGIGHHRDDGGHSFRVPSAVHIRASSRSPGNRPRPWRSLASAIVRGEMAGERLMRRLRSGIGLIIGLLVVNSKATADCDGPDGPVVRRGLAGHSSPRM
jgi:hypothetical protein